MKKLLLILYPLSLLYGFIALVRNKLYDLKILKSYSFDLPLISIGNLSYGGTGKTPHTEYLTRLLSREFNIGILSRGYKRKSKGFIVAEKDLSYNYIGDEPKQYKTKFPEITIAVCENRQQGIKEILKKNANIDCVILDDAFQHRSLKSGLNILLTDISNLYTKDFVLPSGTLREFRRGASRADIIIVTKCSPYLSENEKEIIISEIRPKKHQYVFFSFIEYSPLVSFKSSDIIYKFSSLESVLLFSGIANTKPIIQYFTDKNISLNSICFNDHHEYSINDLIKIRESFNNIAVNNKIIVTTEKDIMRLETPEQKAILKDLPLYYLPVQIKFFSKDKEMFNKIILDYVRTYKKN